MAYRCILWLCKSPENVPVLWFNPILKTTKLQQLVKIPKQGVWNSYHKRYERGTFSVKNGM